jgi:hypothetical protein
MTIGPNYPIPVQVNGFTCKNCTDVDLAKKHIDPAHPRSGPYGVNAKTDPTVNKTAVVAFGGALSALNGKSSVNKAQSWPGSPSSNASDYTAPGAQLNLLA